MPSSYSFSTAVGGPSATTYFLLRRAPQGMQEIADVLGISGGELIAAHTLVPYFESVSPVPLRAQEIDQFATHHHANSRFRINSWKRHPLQFCTQCVRQDIDEIGEPIWRRTHQLPGVRVCVRHRAWLTRDCDACAWTATKTHLWYPPVKCPLGHAFKPQRLKDSLTLELEMQFAKWSEEMLSYRIGARTMLLSKALSQLAARKGLRRWRRGFPAPDDAAENYAARLRNPLLQHAGALVERVSNAPFVHVLAPALRTHSGTRPHPVTVMLCVKALAGSRVLALDALRSVEPRAAPWAQLSWEERYQSLSTYDRERREQLFLSLISERVHLAEARTAAEWDALIGLKLGLSREAIGRWRRLLPSVARALRRARPDLF